MAGSAGKTLAAAFEDHLRKCNISCSSLTLYAISQVNTSRSTLTPGANFGGVVTGQILVNDIERGLLNITSC